MDAHRLVSLCAVVDHHRIKRRRQRHGRIHNRRRGRRERRGAGAGRRDPIRRAGEIDPPGHIVGAAHFARGGIHRIAHARSGRGQIEGRLETIRCGTRSDHRRAEGMDAVEQFHLE